MVFDTNCERCLIGLRPSAAKPHLHLAASWRQPWCS